MDTLEELLSIQKSFQVKNGYDPYIHEIASAIASEGSELWAISGGKWWKEYIEHRDTTGHTSYILLHGYIKDIEKQNRQKIIEESIDVLHFLLIVWLRLGINSSEILEAYKGKMGINQKRQDEHY